MLLGGIEDRSLYLIVGQLTAESAENFTLVERANTEQATCKCLAILVILVPVLAPGSRTPAPRPTRPPASSIAREALA